MSSLPSLSRRSFLKKGMLFLGSLLAAGGLAGSYSTLWEPRWYDIAHTKLPFARLPQAFHGMNIVQISDLHIGHHFNLTHLNKVMSLVRLLQPDLLVFTGDLFDSWVSEDPKETSRILASVDAPYGKWAVLGNHDTYTGIAETAAILKIGGYELLHNAHAIIRSKSGQNLQIAGVEDMWTGNPDLGKALAGSSADAFTLLLSHSANYADVAAGADGARNRGAASVSAGHTPDLQLSGHSHGGQVRLPLLGAITTPPFGDKYVMGLHHVPNSKLLVYTTRGIGTSIYPIRFLCRPEITVLTLESIKP